MHTHNHPINTIAGIPIPNITIAGHDSNIHEHVMITAKNPDINMTIAATFVVAQNNNAIAPIKKCNNSINNATERLQRHWSMHNAATVRMIVFELLDGV